MTKSLNQVKSGERTFYVSTQLTGIASKYIHDEVYIVFGPTASGFVPNWWSA